MYSYGPPHMAEQKQDDQLEHTFSSSVRIRDVALKTCQTWWTIGRSGESGSGISVLGVWQDDEGRRRSDMSQGLSPARLCWSLVHLVQCEPDEPAAGHGLTRYIMWAQHGCPVIAWTGPGSPVLYNVINTAHTP